MLLREVSMLNLVQRFEKYLFENLGVSLATEKWQKEKGLPLFLRDLYYFHECQLLNGPCLVMEARNEEEVTPATIRKHIRKIEDIWRNEVIYLHPAISSYNRKRLIEHKISFVVPGNQMYLPVFGIDLREHMKGIRSVKKKISPSTQAVVLFVLYNWPGDGLTPSQLAGQLNYTPMTLTRAFDEIETAGLGNVEMEWRERVLYFEVDRKSLWEKSLDLLRSPVRKRVKVTVPYGNTLPLLLAGESALPHYSMMAEPSHRTYAMSADEWKVLQLSKKVTELKIHEPGSIEIEIWKYDPTLFARDGVVDPLSLHLSLQDTKDERVEKAIGNLLEKFQW
jgi:hypothetical protein